MTDEEKQALYDKLNSYLEGTTLMAHVLIEPVKVTGDISDIVNNIAVLNPMVKFGDKMLIDYNYFDGVSSSEPAM